MLQPTTDLDELSDVCRIMKIDCLILTESKIDDTIPNNILTIPGFHEPIRRDRNRHGGGTMIYVAEHLTFKQQTLLQNDQFDHLLVDIKVREKIYSVNALYRPSSQTTSDDYENFLTVTKNILTKLQNHKTDNHVLASDMNFGNCYCKLPICVHTPLDASAPELFQSYGYTQLIDIPTRITDSCTSLIDLIYVQNTDSITAHGTLPRIADHDRVSVSFHCTQDKPRKQTKNIFDYTNINTDLLHKHINQIDFQTLVFSKPISDQAECFTNILTDLFKQYVPTNTITTRPNDQPWTNTYTRLLLRKKNQNYQLYKKANNKYLTAVYQPNTTFEVRTVLLNNKNKGFSTARESANQSKYANKRAKIYFFNTVNSTMNNYEISPKKSLIF